MARILLIDDEIDFGFLLAEQLESFGHQVVYCQSAGQAHKTLKELPYDLVLLDIFLGDGNGFDVLQKMRACLPEVPVVILSGSFEFDGHRIPADGATAVLTKPFELQSLFQLIAKSIAS